MALNDLVEVRIPFRHDDVDGVEATCVLHYRQSSANAGNQTDFGEALALSTRITAHLTEHAAAFLVLGEQVTVGPVRTVGITTPTVEGVGNATKVGGGTLGVLNSPRTAAVIQKLTGLRGRSYRGRMFLPFVPSAIVEDGVIMDDELAGYDALITGIVNLPQQNAAASQDMVIWSRTNGTAQAVVDIVAQSRVGSVRTRWSV